MYSHGHESCTHAPVPSKHSLYWISQWQEKLSKLAFSRAGCKRSVIRLCEKSHIFHILLLQCALLPNIVFNKHLKTASRQYWNESMSSHTIIIRRVERSTHTSAPLHTWSHQGISESPQQCNEFQISAYSCITPVLKLFCVVIMP